MSTVVLPNQPGYQDGKFDPSGPNAGSLAYQTPGSKSSSDPGPMSGGSSSKGSVGSSASKSGSKFGAVGSALAAGAKAGITSLKSKSGSQNSAYAPVSPEEAKRIASIPVPMLVSSPQMPSSSSQKSTKQKSGSKVETVEESNQRFRAEKFQNVMASVGGSKPGTLTEAEYQKVTPYIKNGSFSPIEAIRGGVDPLILAKVVDNPSVLAHQVIAVNYIKDDNTVDTEGLVRDYGEPHGQALAMSLGIKPVVAREIWERYSGPGAERYTPTAHRTMAMESGPAGVYGRGLDVLGFGKGGWSEKVEKATGGWVDPRSIIPTLGIGRDWQQHGAKSLAVALPVTQWFRPQVLEGDMSAKAWGSTGLQAGLFFAAPAAGKAVSKVFSPVSSRLSSGISTKFPGFTTKMGSVGEGFISTGRSLSRPVVEPVRSISRPLAIGVEKPAYKFGSPRVVKSLEWADIIGTKARVAPVAVRLGAASETAYPGARSMGKMYTYETTRSPSLRGFERGFETGPSIASKSTPTSFLSREGSTLPSVRGRTGEIFEPRESSLKPIKRNVSRDFQVSESIFKPSEVMQIPVTKGVPRGWKPVGSDPSMGNPLGWRTLISEGESPLGKLIKTSRPLGEGASTYTGRAFKKLPEDWVRVVAFDAEKGMPKMGGQGFDILRDIPTPDLTSGGLRPGLGRVQIPTVQSGPSGGLTSTKQYEGLAKFTGQSTSLAERSGQATRGDLVLPVLAPRVLPGYGPNLQPNVGTSPISAPEIQGVPKEEPGRKAYPGPDLYTSPGVRTQAAVVPDVRLNPQPVPDPRIPVPVIPIVPEYFPPDMGYDTYEPYKPPILPLLPWWFEGDVPGGDGGVQGSKEQSVFTSGIWKIPELNIHIPDPLAMRPGGFKKRLSREKVESYGAKSVGGSTKRLKVRRNKKVPEPVAMRV